MELKLTEKLHLLGIPFRTEQELRRSGYPKTPDIHLQVPFGHSSQFLSLALFSSLFLGLSFEFDFSFVHCFSC